MKTHLHQGYDHFAQPGGHSLQELYKEFWTTTCHFKKLSSHGTDNCSGPASGILALMEKFQTYLDLKLSVLVFDITEQLSVILQGVDTNANDCFAAIDVTIQDLTGYRSDEIFKIVLELVKQEVEDK